jgi:hypothetical protein
MFLRSVAGTQGSCRVVGLFLLLISLGSLAFAQAPTGTILGTVKDSSGAVMPNAAITATNSETGQKRTLSSAADGSYRISALPVGTYEIRVEHEGFQSSVRNSISLTVAQEAVVNFSLSLGAVEQEVSVTAEAPLVNTTSGALGGLVSEEKVADLPLNGRNYINLSLLQAGVVQSANIGKSTQSVGTWFSSNGAPVRSNYYLLDGAPTSDATGSSTASVSGNTLGLEGIREWRIITNSFSAEYGMTMGSQVVMVSKGGTNNFHGSLFEYIRNSAFDARNFFDYKSLATTRRIPAFVRNNYGGSVGGPVRKDKTFFFVTYEALRERLGQYPLLNTIPAAARVDGGAGGVPTINPVVKPLITLYPLPNVPGTNFYTFNYVQPTDDDFGQARVDHTFSDNDSLFARATLDAGRETDSSGFNPFILQREGRVMFYTLSESHIFNPTLLSTARVSFSRVNKHTATPSGISGPQFSFVPGKEIGTIGITGVSGLGGDGVSPFQQTQNVWTYSDDIYLTKGRHSLKFGVLAHHYQQFFFQSLNTRGAISFASLTNFLNGVPSTQNRVVPGAVTDRSYHFNTWGFYGQDDVRVNDRLTLNLGLRWEYLTQPHEVSGKAIALIDIRRDSKFTLGADPFKNPSLKDFSPRLGFAWDVMGNGSTAVRGGFGLLYDLATYGSTLQIATTGQPPISGLQTLGAQPSFTIPFSIPAGTPFSIRGMDYNIQQPHLLQYNMTIERQLPATIAVTLSYVGTRGINLIRLVEGNPNVPQILPDGREFYPVGATRANPNFGTFEYHPGDANSFYNSLQFGLSKRLSHGLQFQSNYTYSRCIDETQGQLLGDSTADPPVGSDPWNRITDRGRCTFDRTQNWQFHSLYRMPQFTSGGGIAGALLNGWWAGGIMAAQTGLPFTPLVSANRSRSGVNGGQADRPDLVAGRTWKDIVSGESQGCLGAAAGRTLGGPSLYFDPCAFAIAPAGFLGNAGRTILSGPGMFTVDLTLAKDTPLKYLGEAGKLEFRAEAFNLLNRANFSIPSRNVFAGTADVQAPIGTAGQITSTIGNARQIQFALKLLF